MPTQRFLNLKDSKKNAILEAAAFLRGKVRAGDVLF